MESDVLRITRQPLASIGGRTGDGYIRLQKRQDADVAQKAAVVVRDVGVGIGERRKLRECRGAQ